MSPISRRDFLIRSGKALAATAVAGGAASWFYGRSPAEKLAAGRIPSYAVDSGASEAVLSIARSVSASGSELVKQALEGLGGMSRFVGVGESVLIKPNAAFASPPALGATTSPEVLGETVRQCLAAGARRVVVADNPIGSVASCWRLSGLGAAATSAGAEVYGPRESDFHTVAVPGRVIGKWEVLYEPLVRADKVIGVPTLKTHNRSDISAAMKNWYGFLGGRRGVLHQRLHGAIADLAEMVRPTLLILDATRKLVRNGPTGGSLSDVEAGYTVVAGTDQVAIDALAGEMLNIELPQFVRAAANRGLGNPLWREVPHVGDL